MDYKLPAPATFLAFDESQIRAEINKINQEIEKVVNLLKTSPEKRQELIDRLALLKATRGHMSDHLESLQ